MGYLSAYADSIGSLSGFPANQESLAYAEELINAYTGCLFGAAPITFTSKIRLEAASYQLPLPIDVQSVSTATGVGQDVITHVATVMPAAGVVLSLRLNRNLLQAEDSGGLPYRFGSGLWTVAGTRGYPNVPGAVIKAASLLVAAYLEPSDPDRSRFANLNLGDFGGTMRLSELPVPEAMQMLNAYRNRVQVSV
ncbi:MAG: hypothetical protein IVW51_16795 [Thermaceae bacterium]|nr:hypothetical protein [Thermaceae bacterium]